MAKKPQGIAGLNIGDTQNLLGQMEKDIGPKPLSYNQLLDLYSKGIMGEGSLKDRFIPKTDKFKFSPNQTRTDKILKQIGNFGLEGVDLVNQGINQLDAFTNPTGNIIGDYLSSEDPESYKKRESNISGPEVFLPNENSSFREGKNKIGAQTMVDVPGMDIFTEAGQQALTDQINAVNQNKESTTDNTDGSATAEEENNITKQTTDTDGSGENLTAAQTATKTALSEFLAQARPGVEPQTYDEYIKEFGDATGLDISGEPDTKQALMSFGLALMQNRAGKGFDVSKILTSTGEAGEAAMPDFRKAVAESKAVRAKAGEYALGKTKEDQNAAMNRKNYYIVPKGKGGLKGIASNLDKGQFSMLNSYELNNLTNNKEFNEQYEIVPNSTYEKVLAATIKTPEWGEKYLTKYEDIPLFNDAGDDFKIPVQRLNGNYKGPDKPKRGFFNPEKYDDYYGRFKRMDTKINKLSDQLGKAFKISSDGKLNFGGQVADDIKGFAQAFGIGDGGKATDAAEVEYILNSVAAKNSPKILGEAGKTISDNDRLRVEAIIGKMKKTGSPAALRLALQEVYELIVVEGKRDIRQGLSTLNRYSGRKSPNFEKKSLSSEVNEQGVYQVQDK